MLKSFVFLKSNLNRCVLCYVHLNRFYCTKKKLCPPWRIMFFGTDDFAVKSLKALCSKLRTGTYISKLSVTTCLSSSKHKNAVYTFATEENLEIHEWPLNSNDITDKFDIGVVTSFGHLIPGKIIKVFPLGILNVHGSLLPRWRGAAPIVHAVMNGDTQTGITIMKISPKKFDVGDIVRQYSISISPNETTPELSNRLADIGAKLLIECIRDLPYSVQRAVKQTQEGVTYAPRINSEISVVNWAEMTAKQIYDLHRAVGYIYPIKTKWLEQEVKLYDVRLDDSGRLAPVYEKDSTDAIAAGLVCLQADHSVLNIQCVDGKWITVGGLKVFGKKMMSPSEFQNGYLSKILSKYKKFG